MDQKDLPGNGIGIKMDPNAIIIAVMGVTGAGKSSFISQCCPDAENIIGIALDSFTQQCVLYQLQCKGRTVLLIDTPGFNDTKRKDIDVLREVAKWLTSSYKDDSRLNGIVFLHGIHQSRFAGSDLINLKMFKELTGMQHMNHVVLTTSYWDVTPESTGIYREKLLVENDDFWKLMKDAGATVARFKNDRASALSVVESIVVANQKTTIQIQSEMEEGHKPLNQTSAGRELDKEVKEHLQEAQEKLDKENAIWRKAIEDGKEEAINASMAEQNRLKNEMVGYREKLKLLDVDSEALLREKDDEIRRMREETERLRLEQQRSGDQFKKAMEEKEKETIRIVRETDQAHEFDLALSRLAAMHAQERASAEQQREKEEELQEMREKFEAMMMQMKRNGEAAAASQPPPYSQYTQQPQPQHYPAQYYPPTPYYTQPIYDSAAATGIIAAGGISLASLAAGGMCTCM